MAFAFYSSFCKCAKRGRKKTKKLSQFLKSHISELLKRFRSNLKCGVLKVEGVSTAKLVLFHQGSTELRRCENCVFFLPVNILTGVTRRLLGPHDTLPCVLMYCIVSIMYFFWVGIVPIFFKNLLLLCKYTFTCQTL